jgi:thioesterase domain-containing protein/acyl carrier protein
VRRGASGSGRSLARRLAAAPASERAMIATEAVLSEIADALGYDQADATNPQQPLRELGFDSLSALELRDRLSGLFGVPLALSAVLEYPTAAALANHLISQPDAIGQSDPEHNPTVASPTGAAGELGQAFQAAHEQGTLPEFLATLQAAALTRRSFSSPRDAGQTERLIPLSDGTGEPSLICLPSLLAVSGPHEYLQLARALSTERAVTSLVLPGFRDDAPLPATLDAAVELLATIVARETAARPSALLGHSSGGLLAHAVASRLESEGASPAAVILIDTYPTATDVSAAMLSHGVATILTQAATRVRVSDTQFIAMGAYMRLITGWTAPRITAPTLLLRASEPLNGMHVDGNWRASWPLPHTAIDIPGDHLTIMSTHISSTAETLTAWLSETCRTEVHGMASQ